MRVTTKMQFEQLGLQGQSLRGDAARSRAEIASGKKVMDFGTDAAAARRVMIREGMLREIDSRRTVTNEANLLLSQQDATLSDIANVGRRLYEMTIQFSNDSYTGEDRDRAIDEVAHLRERLVELGNTQSQGRYVFGGLATASPPFDATGAYSGDTLSLRLPVGDGATVEATLAGGAPFIDAATGANIFDTLDALEAALGNDDSAQVGALVDQSQANNETVFGAMQLVGHRMERVEDVEVALDNVELSTASALSSDLDTDITEAIIDLRKSETALEAALRMTAQVEQLNLMNFVGG